MTAPAGRNAYIVDHQQPLIRRPARCTGLAEGGGGEGKVHREAEKGFERLEDREIRENTAVCNGRLQKPGSLGNKISSLARLVGYRSRRANDGDFDDC